MKTCFLYGALGGDIAGSRFEWNNIKHKDFLLFDEESQLTDDSVLTIATADAIINKISYKEAYYKWGNMYPRAGYGGSFRKWLKSRNPQPYNSWGNGSAMRVSPVGFVAKSFDEVLSEAKASAEVTHNHPEGIKGAQATALAVFMAKENASKEEIKNEMELRFGYDLSSQTLDDIRPDYTFDVSCQGTLPVALLAFLESTDYEDALRNAISVGGDSDTIAAITGGIALAYYKDMPYNIIQDIERRLPDTIREICDAFQVYTENCLKAQN
ncbi:MAG: ADP-ribosylglycohydrolase family protein [Lentisphaeria bacterium]|nr:ADP-ribosylglycohydrolase family protein [Lentisphaeria bacterium]